MRSQTSFVIAAFTAVAVTVGGCKQQNETRPPNGQSAPSGQDKAAGSPALAEAATVCADPVARIQELLEGELLDRLSAEGATGRDRRWQEERLDVYRHGSTRR